MTDSEGPASTPKVIVAVPPDYWDLPEDERLAAAGEPAGQFQEDLRPGS